jgi:heme oxygenase
MSKDILAALRAATANRHAVLDQGMPLAQAEPTLADYRDHLDLLHTWLAPIEAWQSGFSDGPQDSTLLPPAPHLPLIEADLRHHTLPPRAAAPVHWQPAPFTARGPAYRWGVSYVIEGSRLGGAVLHRQLAERLAPHPLRYLAADGLAPGPRWQHFIRTLRAEVHKEADIDAACTGACDAFDSLLALAAA